MVFDGASRASTGRAAQCRGFQQSWSEGGPSGLTNFFKASPLRGGFDEIEDDEFADDPLFEDERADLSFRPDFLPVGLSVEVRFSEACVILGGFVTGVPFGEIPPSFACSR
jgi:hypothetical protein